MRTSDFRGYYNLLLESLEAPHPNPTSTTTATSLPDIKVEPELPLPSSQSLSAKFRPFVFHPDFHSKPIPPTLNLSRKISKKFLPPYRHLSYPHFLRIAAWEVVSNVFGIFIMKIWRSTEFKKGFGFWKREVWRSSMWIRHWRNSPKNLLLWMPLKVWNYGLNLNREVTDEGKD